jgi:hypothetical protein
MNIANILVQVEEVRQELNKIGKAQKLVDAEVIRVSQQLDDLINNYQKLLKRKQHK